MDFFCLHRDRAASGGLRSFLQEEHWSYMDRFDGRFIARGPTLAGDSATGSVHILDLPDRETARAFALDEPNYQAGVYRDVLLRRWDDGLGRTMWDFPDGQGDGRRYLVLGLGCDPEATPPPTPQPAPGCGGLIAYGQLRSDDGSAWVGTAALVQAPDRDHAGSVLTAEDYSSVEVSRWEFGGR